MTITAHFRGGPLDGQIRDLPVPWPEYRAPVLDGPRPIVNDEDGSYLGWDEIRYRRTAEQPHVAHYVYVFQNDTGA